MLAWTEGGGGRKHALDRGAAAARQNGANGNGVMLRGDPFITFAERGRGGGYPKANVVSEVA